LSETFQHVPKFITHAAAAKVLTKRGNTASPSSALSPSSSPSVAMALEEPLLALPPPFKVFRAAAFLGGLAWVVVGVLEEDPDGTINFLALCLGIRMESSSCPCAVSAPRKART
jgi:hypothetical protein